jgi:hypothetical protein
MPVYAGHLETKVWQHHRFEDTAPNFDSDFAYQSLGITFCDHGPASTPVSLKTVLVSSTP